MNAAPVAGMRHCPYAGYARLRRETPVWYDRSSGIWMVSRFEDVRTVLRDAASFSARVLCDDDFPILSPATGHPLPAEQSLLGSDPPAHDRFRKIIAPFFSGKLVESCRETAEEVLSERLRAVGPAGHCEIVEDLCAPVLASVIGRIFGMEAGGSAAVARWMKLCGQLNARSRPTELGPAFGEMSGELWRAACELRATGGAGLLASAVRCHEAGELEDAQVVDFAIAILKGAADTTSFLVGNALCTLTERAAYAESPADFIEESLRFDSPVQMTMRITTREVELSGTRIPRGSRLLVLIGSANRDEEAFVDAGEFRPDRAERNHLAFGYGAHRCPGAAIARMTGSMIVGSILARMKRLRLVAEGLRPTGRAAFRGFQRIEVTFEAFLD